MTTRMDGYDALLWQTETHPLLRSGIVAVVLLDGDPHPDALRERVAELAAGLPRMHSAPIRRPRPFAPHRWSSLGTADLDDHMSWTSATEVGQDLAGLVAELLEQPYTAERPLWSFHVLTDLPDGQAALLARMHHSITDGLGAMTMAACFFDADASGSRFAVPEDVATDGVSASSGQSSGQARAALDSVTEDLRAVLRLGRAFGASAPGLLRDGLRSPVGTTRRVSVFGASLAAMMAPVSRPLSPAFGDRSLTTEVAMITIPLADLRAAGRSVGGRVNDAFMAALALGLQAYHEQQGVAAEEVRASMPVSYRASGDTNLGGNQFSPVRVRLPIGASSAREAIQVVTPALRRAVAEPAVTATPAIAELLARLPGPVANAIVGGMMTKTELQASNVPGSPVPLWCAGRKVTDLYAAAPRMGTAISACLVSYDGTASVLLNMDASAVADPALLEKCLQDAFDQVGELGRQPSPASVPAPRTLNPRGNSDGGAR